MCFRCSSFELVEWLYVSQVCVRQLVESFWGVLRSWTSPVVCLALSGSVKLIKLWVDLNVRMSFPCEGEYVATAFAADLNGW